MVSSPLCAPPPGGGSVPNGKKGPVSTGFAHGQSLVEYTGPLHSPNPASYVSFTPCFRTPPLASSRPLPPPHATPLRPPPSPLPCSRRPRLLRSRRSSPRRRSRTARSPTGSGSAPTTRSATMPSVATGAAPSSACKMCGAHLLDGILVS